MLEVLDIDCKTMKRGQKKRSKKVDGQMKSESTTTTTTTTSSLNITVYATNPSS